MKNKKETKIKEAGNEIAAPEAHDMAQITSKTDLRAFVTDVRDKLLNEKASPIFAMAAMQHVMSLDSIYDLLDKDNKEILQEIWVKLAQSGFHLRKPPLLFGDGEVQAAAK